MKHISILILKGAELSCIEGPYTFFTKTNEFLRDMGKPPLFTVQLIGLNKEAEVYNGLFTASPNLNVNDAFKSDLIIIPAVSGDFKKVIEMNRDFCPWIVTEYKRGSEVASLCRGSFLLASTGLLKGKKCSTHWLYENDFKQMFPDVRLMPDQVITHEHGIYSSGGANSFWNLLLYLVEKYIDRDMAILCSKYFAIDIDRKSQASYIMFKGQKLHQDECVKNAQEYIESHFWEKMTVDQLAVLLNIGKRSLERRFKKATSLTVSEYIQRVRIEVAKEGFEIGRKNIDEVMSDVGYLDAKAFRIAFKKLTGLSPLEYKNKYIKESKGI